MAPEHHALLLEEQDAPEAAVEEVREQQRCRGVAELLLRVAEAQRGAVRGLERLQLRELERLGRGVEAAVDAVGEADEERDVRMLRAERAREHPRVGEVRLGDERAGGVHGAPRYRRPCT